MTDIDQSLLALWRTTPWENVLLQLRTLDNLTDQLVELSKTREGSIDLRRSLPMLVGSALKLHRLIAELHPTRVKENPNG